MKKYVYLKYKSRLSTFEIKQINWQEERQLEWKSACQPSLYISHQYEATSQCIKMKV